MGIENQNHLRKQVESRVPDNPEVPGTPESISELPEKFQAVVVLGKNWKEYPPKNPQEKWKLRLSLESKMSAIAAGEMYKSGLADKIIFRAGKLRVENGFRKRKQCANF